MEMQRITLLLALGAVLSAAEPALDPADKPKPKAEASATVTVTAEATSVEIVKTPNPVKVLDQIAIRESGARNLAELLPALLPGQILPYGGPGTGSNLYLGGGRTQDVVVLLDGIRISDPTSLAPSFSDFSMEGIDRVEVLQGPASTRYGSDTHGGVVALYSAGPAMAGFSGTATLTVGNREVRQAQVSPAFGWNGGWVKASASASQEAQSIPADQPFRTVGSALNFGQQIAENGLLTLTYRNHYRGTPLPFSGTYTPPTWEYSRVFDPSRESAERDQNLVGAYRQVLGNDWLVEVNFGHLTNQRVEPGMNQGDPNETFRGQRNQALGSLTWTPMKGVQVNLLLDHSGETTNLSGNGATGLHDAAALEFSREWESGFRAVASGRYQKDSIRYTFSAGGSLPARDSDRFVYKAGLNWLSKGGLRLYASYGTSYNTPDLSMFTHNLAKGYGELGNETSHGGQIGASLTHGPWQIKLEGSRTLYDQVVNYLSLGYPNYKYENGTNLRVQGIESSLLYAERTWNLEGFVRSQEARNLSQVLESQLTTSGAAGRPFLTGGLRGAAAWGDWKLAGRWSYTGSSYQYFDDLGSVDGARTHFNDLSLALTWTALRSLSLTLRGEHLMQRAWSKEAWLEGRLMRKNDAYLLPVFPTQGPTVSLEARYRF